MADLPPLLRLGTSSFSSNDWIGPFYPAGTRPADMLPYYASRYDTVEIDSTYYRSPSRALCARWAGVTPPGFRFSLKVPRDITADKVLVDVDREWGAFLESTGELGPKLEHLLLQFPYFNLKSACPDVEAFLGRLDGFLARAGDVSRLVVEVRNPKWIGPRLLDSLRARGVGFALTDQEWMPAPSELWQRFGPALRTGPSAYVRLLGERKRIEALTKTWERTVIDRTTRLLDILPSLQALLAEGVPVWAYFNNHYAGHGPASIELMKTLWP